MCAILDDNLCTFPNTVRKMELSSSLLPCAYVAGCGLCIVRRVMTMHRITRQRIQEIELCTQSDNRMCGIAEHIIQTLHKESSYRDAIIKNKVK